MSRLFFATIYIDIYVCIKFFYFPFLSSIFFCFVFAATAPDRNDSRTTTIRQKEVK